MTTHDHGACTIDDCSICGRYYASLLREHTYPKEKGERVVCSVVDGECTAPAGYRVGGLGGGIAEGSGWARCECAVCGQPVCGKCSKRKTMKFGRKGHVKLRVRVCNNCIEDQERFDKKEKS